MDLKKIMEIQEIKKRTQYRVRESEELDLRLMIISDLTELNNMLDAEDSVNFYKDPFWNDSELFEDVNQRYIISMLKEIDCKLARFMIELKYNNADMIEAMGDTFKTGFMKVDKANVRTKTLRMISSLSSTISGVGAVFYCWGQLKEAIITKYKLQEELKNV
ncbi:MAG: hypothetical protein ACRCXX_11675 [Cetobacterium sp.]|uniref:hypothetical protein n=1 Tax=Cetobacterium sp. TaxID=2071632 RepID=UPI003F306D71